MKIKILVPVNCGCAVPVKEERFLTVLSETGLEYLTDMGLIKKTEVLAIIPDPVV